MSDENSGNTSCRSVPMVITPTIAMKIASRFAATPFFANHSIRPFILYGFVGAPSWTSTPIPSITPASREVMTCSPLWRPSEMIALSLSA